ncbi:MAG: peptidoglycan editing factor PgeF [Hahellaceae bacterium]|nr:peptidoglycan editing factor PgeF [Hahellaceae bacterium]MCP5170045.1 peptidoglycan editing factor PgeF [Hahellaceae bacterium]
MQATVSIESERLIVPDWPAPENVKALISTRQGGCSQAPFKSFNLGDHVGDCFRHVSHNRQCLLSAGEGLQTIQWLKQVHGIAVCEAQGDDLVREADASFTQRAGLGCAVMTADCLPVLFCNQAGTRVAAAHAGWRGLLKGVLEATLARFDSDDRIFAYLGPAIGPQAFEVGLEVYDAFVQINANWAQAFQPSEQPAHWYADLYALARMRLAEAGVSQVFGGDYCTYTDANRFFSHRRDRVTGRMASLIWLAS